VALLVMPLVYGDLHHDAHGAEAAIVTEAEIAEQLDLEAEAQTADSAVDREAHAHEEGAGAHEHKWFGRGMSLLFALLGALLLSFGRLRDERIPHEAIIGIIFVVCAALSVLILSKAPHGHERMEAMLVGSILFVRWADVAVMMLLYTALGIFHIALRKSFVEITKDVAAADRAGQRVRLWDCLFYGSFALMVTQSVSVAGVLVVFSYLIIPAACATLFADGFGRQLVVAWIVAVAVTAAGLVLSAVGDLPTGASLVSSFGLALVVCVTARAVLGRQHEGVA
jgi:zinc/manganese transport system permease protein